MMILLVYLLGHGILHSVAVFFVFSPKASFREGHVLSSQIQENLRKEWCTSIVARVCISIVARYKFRGLFQAQAALLQVSLLLLMGRFHVGHSPWC